MESESWEVIYERIRRQFAEGAEERLANIGRSLDRLEQGETDPGVLRDILYEFHKLAGSAGSYGFTRVSEISLQAEIDCRAVMERDGGASGEDVARWRAHLGAISDAFVVPKTEAEQPGGGDES